MPTRRSTIPEIAASASGLRRKGISLTSLSSSVEFPPLAVVRSGESGESASVSAVVRRCSRALRVPPAARLCAFSAEDKASVESCGIDDARSLGPSSGELTSSAEREAEEGRRRDRDGVLMLLPRGIPPRSGVFRSERTSSTKRSASQCRAECSDEASG